MNCPACGSDRLSATTCLVCGALLNAHPPSAASRPADVQHSRLISDSRMPARSQAPPRVDVMTRSNPIRGVARAVHLRTEPSSLKGPTWQILDFRLDRFSEDGRPLPSVPVEMRRLHLTGSVSEGETVEVRGKLADRTVAETHAPAEHLDRKPGHCEGQAAPSAQGTSCDRVLGAHRPNHQISDLPREQFPGPRVLARADQTAPRRTDSHARSRR